MYIYPRPSTYLEEKGRNEKSISVEMYFSCFWNSVLSLLTEQIHSLPLPDLILLKMVTSNCFKRCSYRKSMNWPLDCQALI